MVTDQIWTTPEKRPPSPQIISETTDIVDHPTPAPDDSQSKKTEESSDNDKPVSYLQTEETDKKAVRPVSLATVSRIEHLSNLSPHGEEGRQDIKEDDVVVIRLKGKKGKKAKKKRKAKSLSQGNTPTCAGAAPGFVQDEDNASLEFDMESRSKSSSFSSQSTSDKSSLLDLSMLSASNQDVQNGSNPALSDGDKKSNKELTTSEPIIPSPSEKSSDAVDSFADCHKASLPPEQVDKHCDDQGDKLLDTESHQDNAKKQLDSCSNTHGPTDMQSKDTENLNSARNLDNECVLLEDNVQSEPPTTQPVQGHNEPKNSISHLPKTSSLDYDTTIEYSLSSVDYLSEEKPSLSQLSQVQFESSMDDSMMLNLSIDDPGYTNLLLTNSVPSSLTPAAAEQSESDLSTSSGQGSSSIGQGSLTSGRSPMEEGLSDGGENVKGSEQDDLTPLGERSSPEGIDSSKVIVDSSEVIGASEGREADKKSIVEAAEEVNEISRICMYLFTIPCEKSNKICFLKD